MSACKECRHLVGAAVQYEGQLKVMAHRLHRSRDRAKLLAEIATIKETITNTRARIDECEALNHALGVTA